MKKQAKKYLWPVVVTAVVASIIGWYFFVREAPGPDIDYMIAERGELIQEVSVTGRVKPAQSVTLAFEKGGRVANVYVDVGDLVSDGQALVSLENIDIVADMEQAEAKEKAAQAKLDELLRGTRPEEIQVQEVKVQNAKTALAEAKRNLVDKIEDAYTRSDDAVRNQTDQFFDNPRGNDPKIKLTINNTQLKSNVEFTRLTLETLLTQWQNSLLSLTPESDLSQYSDTTKDNLDTVKTFLSNIALIVNSQTASASLTQATIDSYKSDVASARTSINTAIANLTAALKELDSKQATLLLEEQELALDNAGVAAEEITAQEAAVEEARALVKSYQAELSKTIIRSPFYGTVSSQDATRGEIVAANTILVSLISEAEFEIEANVPEADVAKLEVGDQARVTLDAYTSDDVFGARVVSINPAETIIEGVATYKTTLQFTEKDERVKSGMTANIDISTDSRTEVIAVPARAVTSESGSKYVRILVLTGEIQKRAVKTGLRGSDGRIEITEGVQEGEQIIIFFEE